MLKTDLLTFGITGAVFKIAGEMRLLPAYSDNPGLSVKFIPGHCDWKLPLDTAEMQAFSQE